MNKGALFPIGVFLAFLLKETLDVAGANAVVAAVERSAVLAASRNFIVMLFIDKIVLY